jgi:hypothetical protein
MFDASFPEGWWYYFRSCDVATLTDEVIDITADHAQRIRSPLTAFPIFHLGGAVGRVSDHETAFHGRTAGHTFNINATTATRDGFEEERDWSRSFWSATGPRRLRQRQVRPTTGAETQVRPGQRLPPQPEHPARLISCEAAVLAATVRGLDAGSEPARSTLRGGKSRERGPRRSLSAAAWPRAGINGSQCHWKETAMRQDIEFDAEG